MESIKKWMSHNKKGQKDKNNEDGKHQIIPPFESLPSTQKQTRGSSSRRNSVRTAMMNFIPRTQGHEATIAYLHSGRTSDLSQLLGERDRAERLVYQGPKTKATREVQEILREPSIQSVEQFYRVYMQAEFSLKYGIAGELVYNFSKPPSWNKANVPRLPSPQPKDFSTMMKGQKALIRNSSHIPRNPATPIDWIDTETSRSLARSNSRPLSVISEPGGWRDSSQSDTHEEQMHDLRSPSLAALDVNTEDEWDIGEAQILTVTRVPIRQVHITPQKR
ncbi:hypothetical protein F4781DRAFT_300683 [Annulohypoxylon bovei var. microspora]|nr:hypothetical protein F4781DRAFT_300683 [Annulohypoxylon bovei var. microspora]